MTTLKTLFTRTPLLLLPVLALSACAGDFVSDPSRPHSMRAVSSPGEQNSASGEMTSDAAAGNALLSVEFPNKKEESPKVHSFLDPLNKPSATPPAATAPAQTPPPSVPPTAGRTDPVFGPNQ